MLAGAPDTMTKDGFVGDDAVSFVGERTSLSRDAVCPLTPSHV